MKTEYICMNNHPVKWGKPLCPKCLCTVYSQEEQGELDEMFYERLRISNWCLEHDTERRLNESSN